MSSKPRSMFTVYEVRMAKDERGNYAVTVPSLPKCRAIGSNEAEALDNIKVAISECLKSQEPNSEADGNRRFVIIETRK